MRLIITFFLLLFAYLGFSQGGFFNRYNFDNTSVIFGNIQINNDTIIVHGMVRNPDPPHQQGLIFMKLDSFGQVLHQYASREKS